MADPRIDTLGSTAILTDTQLRLAFAPLDPEAKVSALQIEVRADKIVQMQALAKIGTVHFQIKSGFGEERSIELTVPEVFLLIDLADRFVTELPRAQAASATNG